MSCRNVWLSKIKFFKLLLTISCRALHVRCNYLYITCTYLGFTQLISVYIFSAITHLFSNFFNCVFLKMAKSLYTLHLYWPLTHNKLKFWIRTPTSYLNPGPYNLNEYHVRLNGLLNWAIMITNRHVDISKDWIFGGVYVSVVVHIAPSWSSRKACRPFYLKDQ